MSEGDEIIVTPQGTVRIPLSIKFNGCAGTNAAVVGESLLALESLVRKSAPVFRKIMRVNARERFHCSLRVERIEPGSLAETLLVEIPFGSSEAAHQKFQEIMTMLPVSPTTVATLIIGGILGAGALWACRKLRGGANIQPMVEAHNSIVVASAGKLNLSNLEFNGLYDRLKGKNGIAKDAVMALQPGVVTGAGGVRIGQEADGIVIPGQAAAVLPNPDEMDGGDELRVLPLENTELTIVASDRDHSKTGWAVQLPADNVCAGIRIKAELGDGVNPAVLMYRRSARCDGELVVARREDGNSLRPRKILIKRLSEDSANSGGRA